MKKNYRRMIRVMQEKAGRKKGKKVREPWHLYILECADGSFYTGITKDVDRRLAEHNAGKASRYTRVRRPVILRYQETCRGRAAALARECAVKALSRREKEKLVDESGS